MGIETRILKKQLGYIDENILQLEKAASYLDGAIPQLITDKPTKAVDYLLTRNNIQDLLLESGYYEVGNRIYTEGFQMALDDAYQLYKKKYDVAFRYADVSLENFEQLQEAMSMRFSDLGYEYTSRMTQEVIDLQFGGAGKSIAKSAIQKSSDTYFNRYVYTWTNTSIGDYQSKASTQLATDNGVNEFEYVGVEDNLTRDFCSRMIGQVKTQKEWENTLNDFGEPAWSYRGGWNCRHRFIAVVK